MSRTQTRIEALRSTAVVAGALIAGPAEAQVADSFNPGVNPYAYCVALQADGKVLVGGSFTTLAGQPRNRIGRLSSDGSLDTGFNPGANNGVSTMAVQTDWRIVVGGGFTSLAGAARSRIGRLNPDGSPDTTFDPGANGAVTTLAVQADGRILVGGDFTTLGGQNRRYLGRLKADGSLDTTFNPAPNSSVFSLAVQPDGRIVVAGGFSTLGGQACSCLGRLNEDGSLDTTFTPAPNSYVYAVALQGDGKILAGGLFGSLGGQTRSRLGRLNGDGSLDLTFASGANSYVYSLAVQADGKVLAAGGFTTLSGKSCNYLGQLNADGSLDTNFVAGANGSVEALALQADGKILVEGYFSSLGGQPRSILGRLDSNSAVTDLLLFDGATISWLRGGAAPEVWRTTFDACTNGADWISLGPGARVPEGWQLGGLSVPTGATLRARGCIAGGLRNGSGWFVETSLGPPAVSLQPVSLTNNAGTTASFAVVAAGAPPLTYQWLKNEAPLSDTTNVTGTHAPSLTLSNVLKADAAGYAVSVSNLFGSVTSHIATLVVVDPFITGQPVSATNNAGTTATFAVAAGGSSPPGYQWLKNGLPINDTGNISGAHTAVLTVSNVLAADAGLYSARVTNLSGSLTSEPAGLVVFDPAIALQPASQGVNLGQPATLAVTAAGTAPLTYQWFKEGGTLAGATASCLALTSPQAADAGSYWAVVSNAFGSVTSQVAVLSVNLAMLESGFSPEAADHAVATFALQPDGRILLAGYLTNAAGLATNRVARLEADGTLDPTFDAVTDRTAACLAVQPDGKILVGGEFSTLCGQPRRSLGRLNADSSLDESFSPAASGLVSWLVVQPDGRILVAGYFVTLGGQTRNHIGRLNPDGTLDASLNSTDSNLIQSLAALPDGRILVGRFFSSPFSSYSTNYIQRLIPDGSLDSSFNAGANYYIQLLAPQPDGKILVAGEFSTLAGQVRNRIGRLNADGTADLTFDPGASGTINALVVQTDGRIVLGGSFSTLGGQTRNNIGRLNADGTLDLTFNPGAAGAVSSLAIQPDGHVLVGGSFVSLGGQTRQYLGRLMNTQAATQHLVLTGTTLNWLRGGASPEIWIAAFDSSPDGTTWSSLGAGTRIPGGWQLTSPELLTSATIRARGFAAGGVRNGSGWFVENTTQLLRILVNDGGFGFTSNSLGHFGFNLVAPTGQYVVVEGSTDLANWTALATNAADTAPRRFDDADPPSLTRRFYRARLK